MCLSGATCQSADCYLSALLLFYFVDDDGDGLIDEDLANPPRGTNIYKYISYSH
jgi:hypothetical protein